MKNRPLLNVESTYLDEPSVGIHKLSGKLLGDESGYGMLDMVRDDIESGRSHVILDLGAVRMANSSGLGILAAIYNTTKTVNGSTTLTNTSGQIKGVLEVTMLWGLISHAETVEDALAGIGS